MTKKTARISHYTTNKVKLLVTDRDDVTCLAWQLSEHLDNMDELLSDNHLQYLTSMEADGCLHDMFKTLKLGGILEVRVPDSDYFARQWLASDWNEASLRDLESDARQSFAGLYGWQRGGNPARNDYDPSHSDCLRSGYNARRLKFLLLRIGFVDISLDNSKMTELVARARKSMHPDERQISPDIRNIREDHLNRYRFAVQALSEISPQKVIDLACGIGYGSSMLAEATGAEILGIDIDPGAIEYAETYYTHPKAYFLCADARIVTVEPESIDAVVSFETIEHVDFDKELLGRFHQFLRPKGRLIISTPNETTMPHDHVRFPFHVRHYTFGEINKLLTNTDFKVLRTYTQTDSQTGRITESRDGEFILLVAEKA